MEYEARIKAMKVLRKLHGWKQSDLAKRTFYSVQMICYIEQGQRKATKQFWTSVARAFSLSLKRFDTLAENFQVMTMQRLNRELINHFSKLDKIA